MTARLRFWLLALDAAHTIRLPRAAYLWCLSRASDATDRGPPLEAGATEGGEPF